MIRMRKQTTYSRLHLFIATLCIAMGCCFMSCVKEDVYENDPEGNFEALWSIIDQHYCFLDFKIKTIGLDWEHVHQQYRQRIHSSMDRYQLFEVLAEMLAELQDGHVNLYAPADIGRNWSWYEDFPNNFSQELQDQYLGTDYKISAGIQYRILDDNIGYATVSSFQHEFGEGNLDEIFHYLRSTNGLILDVRNNGGGYLSSADQLAQRFTNERRLVGYMTHKTGKGHNDFSKPEAQYLDASDGVRWQKPVVILTNRRCYSATNTFIRNMRCCPNVTVIGDQTGGGSGMPFSSELPNGWGVRFSACPMFDTKMNHIEFGIQPDIEVSLNEEDRVRGKDTLIEAARALLKK